MKRSMLIDNLTWSAIKFEKNYLTGRKNKDNRSVKLYKRGGIYSDYPEEVCKDESSSFDEIFSFQY